MRLWLIGFIMAAATPALAQQPQPAVSVIAFDSVANPLRLPPDHPVRQKN